MRALGPDLFQIPLAPAGAVNAHLAHGVLFDAGTRFTRRPLLRALRGREVVAHALTHAHPDHQGASHAVCEAFSVPLFVGAGDADAASGARPLPASDRPLLRLLGALAAGPPHPVAFRLAEGDRVGRYAVVATPGPSRGHVSFWDERDGVLVLGDLLANVQFPSLRPGLREMPPALLADAARTRASARRFAGLRPALVLFGHGLPLRDPDAFDAFLHSLPADP